MPVSIWCILISAILPILSALPAKLDKSFDNADPKNAEYWRDGFRTRAQNAQANGYEAFPFFAIAVVIALGQGGDLYWIDQLSVLFVGLRLIYIACYWTNRSTPRSIAWIASFLTIIAIFTSPVWS